MCPSIVHEKRYSFLSKENARNNGDLWMGYDEGIQRLVSFSRLRSFHSFPSGRIRNRHLLVKGKSAHHATKLALLLYRSGASAPLRGEQRNSFRNLRCNLILN